MSDLKDILQALPAALGRALSVAAVAALAVILSIIGFGEPVSDRTQTLTLVVAFGAFMATMFAALMAIGVGGIRSRLLSSTLGALVTGGGFVPATLLSFAMQNRLMDGRIDDDILTGLRLEDLFWSMFGAMGMFTPTGLRYLAPWPLACVTLAAACIFFFWPRPANA